MISENHDQEVDNTADVDGTKVTGEPVKEHLMPDDSNGFILAEQAAFWMLEIKSEDVVILDLRGRSDVCDFFVIATGLSDVQVKAIGRSVQDHLHTSGQKPLSREGFNEGRWVLLDYFDVVVHIQRPEARQYYRLVSLWGDAPRLEISPTWFADPNVRTRQPSLPPYPNPETSSNAKESD